jgi:hypothetical protein
VTKPVPVQMFEEITGFRATMVVAESRGSFKITTKCKQKFLIKQVGPDLEVIKCR